MWKNLFLIFDKSTEKHPDTIGFCEVLQILKNLKDDKIITYDDLKEFSSELKDVVNYFLNN